MRQLGDDGRFIWGDNDLSIRGKWELSHEWREHLTWYHDGTSVGLIGASSPDWRVDIDRGRLRSWLEPYKKHDQESFEWNIMPFRPLFDPPSASLKIIAAIERGGAAQRGIRLSPDDPRINQFAFLAPDYRLTHNSVCVGIVRERDQEDVIRCRYRAGDLVVRQAMNTWMRVMARMGRWASAGRLLPAPPDYARSWLAMASTVVDVYDLGVPEPTRERLTLVEPSLAGWLRGGPSPWSRASPIELMQGLERGRECDDGDYSPSHEFVRRGY